MRKILFSIIINNSLGEQINQYIQETNAELGALTDNDYPACLVINLSGLSNFYDLNKLAENLIEFGSEYIINTLDVEINDSKVINIKNENEFLEQKDNIKNIINNFDHNPNVGFFAENYEHKILPLEPKSFAGVIGGAGFIATLYYCKMLTEKNIPYIAIYDSFSPNPTNSILNSNLEIIKHYNRNHEFLSDYCEIISIPCNTIHYFYDKININPDVKLINIIESIKNHLENNKKSSNLAILATRATLKMQLFNKISGYNFVILEDEYLIKLQQSIALIKSNQLKLAKNYLSEIIFALINKYNKDVTILLGCTELNVPFNEKEMEELNIISSSKILGDYLEKEYLATYFRNNLDEKLQA